MSPNIISSPSDRDLENIQRKSALPILPARFLLTVEAVLYIALEGGSRPIKLTEAISTRTFSPRHLEGTFQHLVRVKILRSIKGSKGGYALGRPAEEISLADLYQASVIRSARVFHVAETPAHQAVSFFLAQIQSKWEADLANVSIYDLAKRAPPNS